MAGWKFYGTKEHIVLVYWQAAQSILSATENRSVTTSGADAAVMCVVQEGMVGRGTEGPH